MVTINGVDLKANGSGFVIDGGIKIRNPLSGFGDATNFFCLENMGNITDREHTWVLIQMEWLLKSHHLHGGISQFGQLLKKKNWKNFIV